MIDRNLDFGSGLKERSEFSKTSQRSHAVSALFSGLFSDLTHKKDFQKVDKSLANILTELKGVLLYKKYLVSRYVSLEIGRHVLMIWQT